MHRRRTRFPAFALFLLSVLLIAPAVPAPDSRAGTRLDLTPAERSAFRSTPTYAETLDYLRQLEKRFPNMRIEPFGATASGRTMYVVIVSREKAFTPPAAAAVGKPVVMIQNGIHGGEIDGKDACLMILRDLSTGLHRDVLDAATLLIVPVYNVDGHERVSPHNRPNQNGPVEGMGFRTNAGGLDLNRDHLKLASPEARALIGLFNRWRPHLVVDDHVTDGSDHDWVLTYAWVEAPQAPAEVDRWVRKHVGEVEAAMERAGHRTGPYVSLLDRADPARGFDSWVGSGRSSSGYYPLRNRISILVENHSYKPYRDRVLANREFLLSLLREVGKDPDGLVKAVAAAEARTASSGGPEAPPSEIVLRWEPHEEGDTIRFPVYRWKTVPSVALGTPLVLYERGIVDEIEVPWIHRAAPARTAPRPRGYLVLPGWPEIETRLSGHGLEVWRLTGKTEAEVQTLRLSEPEFENRSYQGLTRVSATVAVNTERRTFPEGTLWIPASQRDFQVAVHLLEPESPDSLFSWGILSRVLERKEYIEPRVLEGMVVKMLEDEAVREAWKKALEDPEFAGDSRARWMWWYRRTPHWDETVGMMPVMRVTKPLDLPTERWNGTDGR